MRSRKGWYRSAFMKAPPDDPAGGGGGTGTQPAGGGGTGDPTFTKAQVDAAVEAATSGLKTKNSELLTKVKALGDQITPIKDILDKVKPEDITAAIEFKSKADEERKRNEGKFDEIKTQMADAHKAELAKSTARQTKLEQKLHQVLVRNVVEAEIKAQGGKAKVMAPHIIPFIKVTEVDDDFKVTVVDAKGNPRVADGSGTEMTIEQLVASFKADAEFGVNFEASGTSGTGARSAGTPAAPAVQGGRIVISKKDAQDVGKYRAAKAEADTKKVPLVIGE